MTRASAFDSLADAAAPAIMELAAYCVGQGKRLSDLVFFVTREGEHHDSDPVITRRAPGAVVSAGLRRALIRSPSSDGQRVELSADPPPGHAKCVLCLLRGGQLDQVVADVEVAS
jgi:hypothetical protein